MNIFGNDRSEAREQWALERDRFNVLFHYYNARDWVNFGALTIHNIVSDLGLSEHRADALLRTLFDINFLRYGSDPQSFHITRGGVEYVERGRGRRHSLRLPFQAGRPVFG